ncbi:CDP-alcohol phosphatidyltransferase family protein [Phycicoccus sp. Root563]|uniref:CDP-alcohol phosphatidyltransferase family protein n=1 Tax=Phycicoccus sp. Root563 TaxID=1736562 RepID=UPI0019100496|nr:CDP-alcohol phosphatidyltransferase family protein [Phycicoccus sp. Root563]
MNRPPMTTVVMLYAQNGSTSRWGGAVLTVRRLTGAGVVGVAVLLAVVGNSVGLTATGWAVGLLCGVTVNLVVAQGLRAAGVDPGPADAVTLGRAVITCAVAALTADALLHGRTTALLVPITVVALLLDALDGWVARRTGTTSAFGGRFDGEVDAFLILVLSVYVAPDLGPWVLLAGLVRYLFAVAGWGLPWLRAQLPFRYWRKVVTASVGIVLTVAAADAGPHWFVVTAVIGGLVLLAESFGRDVWWLWRHRVTAPVGAVRMRGLSWRRVGGVVVDTVAVALVWVVLVAPVEPGRLAPVAFLRLPVEGLALAALVVVLSGRSSRVVARVAGLALGLLGVLEVVELAFVEVLDRPVDLVTDAGHLGAAVDFVRASYGPWAATGAQAGAVVLLLALVAGVTASVGRLARQLRRRRRRSALAVVALTVAWALTAVSGAQVGKDEPVAARAALGFAVGQARGISTSLREQRAFDAAVRHDAYADQRTGDLAGLAGKDVLVAFVESYGRVAVEGDASAGVRTMLDAASARLGASGYAARSAYLTSPTFGGVSWLAHSTFLSGVWVDNQTSYDTLLAGNHTTLPSVFARSGWRTVGLLPSNRGTWPQGQRYYGFDTIYDSSDLGYAGPAFGFSSMPDQYALDAFGRRELGPGRTSPVMAEIDLASSHGPWAPLPRMVGWDDLGDGTVFDAVHAGAESASHLWSHRERVPAAYMDSIEYSFTALLGFVERYGSDSLVLVLLGDHQPATIVSGFGGNHDVPVTVLARDPSVLARISSWGWQDGLRPGPRAPVWRMDAFRDRFLGAFGDRSPEVVTAGQTAPAAGVASAPPTRAIR